MSVTRSQARDAFILGKALAIAIEVMKQERPHPQYSDIDDMKLLIQATGMPVDHCYDRELAIVRNSKVREAVMVASLLDWEGRRRKIRNDNVVRFEPKDGPP